MLLLLFCLWNEYYGYYYYYYHSISFMRQEVQSRVIVIFKVCSNPFPPPCSEPHGLDLKYHGWLE